MNAPDPELEPTHEQVHHRAEALLPEELAAGSADPEAQAEAILEESEERTEAQSTEGSPQSVERTSDEAS